MNCVRSFNQIKIWGRNPDKVQTFINKHKNNINTNLKYAENVESAVKNADVICTVTSSSKPILFSKWIRSGAHLNLVGSSVPNKSEVDSDIVLKSKYYVDYLESTLAQAGEFLIAKKNRLLDDSHIQGEI
jgi:ornithine cyclodeaminase